MKYLGKNGSGAEDKIDLNELVAEADLIVGGVLIPGAEAPKLVTKDMLKLMKEDQ